MFRNVIIQYCRNHSNNPRCAQPFVSFRKTREQRQNIYNMYVCDLLPVFVISQEVFLGVGGRGDTVCGELFIAPSSRGGRNSSPQVEKGFYPSRVLQALVKLFCEVTRTLKQSGRGVFTMRVVRGHMLRAGGDGGG